MASLRRTLKQIAKLPGAGPFERLWARWQLSRNPGKLPAPVSQDVPYETTEDFDVRLLLTGKTGVFHYEPGRLRRILAGDFYGLSQFAGRWYLSYRMTSLVSQIISFEFHNGQARDVRREFPFLQPGIHQLDFCGNQLLVADTTMNRLVRYPCCPLPTERGATFAYPNGRAWRGRNSANYAHINSVLSDGVATLLVLHNQTTTTGRRSEIVCLDRDDRLLGRRSLDAGCAHNVVVVDNQIGYCDSQRGDFVLGETRLPLGSFTRGVGAGEERLYVGGSDFAARAKREHSTGLLYCVARDSITLLSRMLMPGVGGVYEVRLLEQADESPSDSVRSRRDQGQLRLEDLFERIPACSAASPIAGAA